ncbi:MAG: CIA30 family protein [Synechococcus sp.]
MTLLLFLTVSTFPSLPPESAQVIASPETFSEWSSLNDTIMGGRSRAGCRPTGDGLVLEGEVVAEGGGFVSCRSPTFRPPLNLQAYQGLRLRVDGDGRTLKLAVACSDGVLGLTELIPGGLRWVAPIPTKAVGTTVVDVRFADLQPVVRASPVTLPVRFQAAAVTRVQLLHSRFAEGGGAQPGFRPGSIRLLLRSVEAF